MSDLPVITWTGHLVVAVNRRKFDSARRHMWTTSARLCAKKPALGKDEVAVKVSVELPVSLFEEPRLEARITVPADSVSPPVIDLNVVKEALEHSTGFNVTIRQEDKA